jgi:hypothetical protein
MFGRFFGPLSIFQYGAASFVYELIPSGSDNYVPTLANTASLFVDPVLLIITVFQLINIISFGAQQLSDGTWTHVPEQIGPLESHHIPSWMSALRSARCI